MLKSVRSPTFYFIAGQDCSYRIDVYFNVVLASVWVKPGILKLRSMTMLRFVYRINLREEKTVGDTEGTDCDG